MSCGAAIGRRRRSSSRLHILPIHGCGRGSTGEYCVALGPGARRSARARLRARSFARLVFTGISTPSLRESVRYAGQGTPGPVCAGATAPGLAAAVVPLGERGLVIANERAEGQCRPREGPSRKGLTFEPVARPLPPSAVAREIAARAAAPDQRDRGLKRAWRGLVQRFPSARFGAGRFSTRRGRRETPPRPPRSCPSCTSGGSRRHR